MIDHERIEERIVAYSLGELAPGQREAFEAEMAEHTRTCRTCAALYADLREVAGRLALATPPVEPSAELEERLMALAGGRADRVRAGDPRRSFLRRAALGAVAAVVLVAGSVGGTLLATRAAPTHLRAVEMRAGDARLAFVYTPGSSEAVVIAHDLPTPEDGNVYQLWIRTGGAMVGAGTFRPREGEAVATTSLPAAEFDLVAVTVEPRGGSSQPTSEPIAASPVDPA